MGIAEISRNIEQREVIEIDRDELAELREAADAVREVDTSVAGWIRILSLDGRTLVQEETPDRVILLRRLDSVQDAEGFVDSRLADYERMWNGCGCKIDYRARHHND